MEPFCDCFCPFLRANLHLFNSNIPIFSLILLVYRLHSVNGPLELAYGKTMLALLCFYSHFYFCLIWCSVWHNTVPVLVGQIKKIVFWVCKITVVVRYACFCSFFFISMYEWKSEPCCINGNTLIKIFCIVLVHYSFSKVLV